MALEFKVGEKQTVVVDLNIDVNIENFSPEQIDDVKAVLSANDQDGNVLFTKEDSDFYYDLEEMKAMVEFNQQDLSEPGVFDVEIRMDIYIGEALQWIEKTRDLKMVIKRSLTEGMDPGGGGGGGDLDQSQTGL